MSHSDSEIKSSSYKLQSDPQGPHVHFKRKRRNREFLKLVKSRCKIIVDEIRLIEAAGLNNTELVERLLKSGISPNATDMENRSALHIAVSRGYADVVQLLLQYGADPNKRDVLHNTPLHLAACTYNVPIIRLLLESGASVSSVDIRGRSPLELAKSKLQILHRCWNHGEIGQGELRKELHQILDMVMTIWLTKPPPKATEGASIEHLQKMKMSLDTEQLNGIDNDMAQLLTGLEGVKIS